ncbi:MAG: hypothetical protein M3430_07595 [Acidobacteriota bacterium]|nr:hypothetical protein [Acidobacteriota bacterium]
MATESDAAQRAVHFAQQLALYPELQTRFEAILALVENERGEANTADEAEERAIEQVRRLGKN